MTMTERYAPAPVGITSTGAEVVGTRIYGPDYVAMQWGGWVSRLTGSDPKYRAGTEFCRRQKSRNGVKGPFAVVVNEGWYELAVEGKHGPRRYEYFDGGGWSPAPDFRHIARVVLPTILDMIAAADQTGDGCWLDGCDAELTTITNLGIGACDEHVKLVTEPEPEDHGPEEAPF